MNKYRPPVTAHVAFQQHRNRFTGKSTREIFRTIHQINLWGCDESVSGLGSALEATKTIRQSLSRLIHNYSITTILDAPCGDFYWMNQVPMEGVRYIGIDIVEAIVKQNKIRYADRSEQVSFLNRDICLDPLPKMDLIICRDCLVHLSFEKIYDCLRNFKQSQSRYLLTTTFLEHDQNDDCEIGDWRMLNLQTEPFSFPEPIEIILENCEEAGGNYNDKSLALWSLDDLVLSKMKK